MRLAGVLHNLQLPQCACFAAQRAQIASWFACLPACLCRKEIERFREATGKDVGALEAEKAARGMLESRTKAQVG